jgi:hypothetical protein
VDALWVYGPPRVPLDGHAGVAIRSGADGALTVAADDGVRIETFGAAPA